MTRDPRDILFYKIKHFPLISKKLNIRSLKLNRFPHILLLLLLGYLVCTIHWIAPIITLHANRGCFIILTKTKENLSKNHWGGGGGGSDGAAA